MKRIFGCQNFFKYSKQIVYYSMKILGLAPFELKDNRFHRAGWLGSLYPFLTMAVELFLLLEYFESITLFRNTENPSVQMRRWFIISSNSSPTFLNVLFFSILRDKFMRLLNDLCEFKRAIEIVGITENSDKYFKNIISFAAPIIAVNLTIQAILPLFNPNRSVSAAIGFSIDQTIAWVIILMFANTMILMKNRFKLMNEKLYKTSKLTQKTRTFSNVEPGRLYLSEIGGNLTSDARGVYTYSKHIRTIGGLHSDLHDLQIRAVDLFSIPISLISIKVINTVTFAIYYSLRAITNWDTIMKGENFSKDYRHGYIFLRPCGHALIGIFQLIGIVCVSVKTSREANAAKTLLIESWTNNKLPELEREIMMFSMQLLRNDHSVSLFRFIALDYSFLYKISASIVAYLIVMIQLGEESLGD